MVDRIVGWAVKDCLISDIFIEKYSQQHESCSIRLLACSQS